MNIYKGTIPNKYEAMVAARNDLAAAQALGVSPFELMFRFYKQKPVSADDHAAAKIPGQVLVRPMSTGSIDETQGGWGAQ